ncbi:MAG TPA: MEDS domain-containing protein [Acidimicrobiales bacterium]|nr:MEDS domain-containing protein [Acidimicrobiales bacterium]
MRASGILEDPCASAGLHVCWCFETHDEFQRAAAEFLAAGRRRGERLVYVADAPAEALWSQLADGGLRPSGDRDLVVQPLADLYCAGGDFDGAAQIEAYEKLVHDARHAGYRGICVACDATGLVATADAHRDFVRYELAIDRFIAEGTMSALCAYQAAAIGARLPDLVGVHPLCNQAATDEQWFRAFFDGASLRLVGEADVATAGAFDAVLAVLADGTKDVRELDLSELTFVDVRSLVRLSKALEARASDGHPVTIRDVSDIVRRCAERLDLRGFFAEELA